MKLHPLVQKTKIELQRLDKVANISMEERQEYASVFLPISVEPKLRKRALKFMNDLINLLEANGHKIKFYLNRCHIEMYGQLTEIHLRQKYFRKRIKGASGYSSDTFEKSDKLEFQIGSYARKGWIDKKTKTLEDYLPGIYSHIEKDSKWWLELREQQKIEKKIREFQRVIEEDIARQKAIEVEKFQKLITDADNYNRANSIRSYLKAYESKITDSNSMNLDTKEYLEWAHIKVDEIDPICNLKLD